MVLKALHIPNSTLGITADAQKSLKNMARVLQKLANEITFSKDESPIMFPCNRFIKRNLKKWQRISHKLVVPKPVFFINFQTGEDLVTEDTSVTDLTEDDLIFSSNIDMSSEDNEYVLTKVHFNFS